LSAAKRLVFRRTHGIPSGEGPAIARIAKCILEKAHQYWAFRVPNGKPVQYVKICSLYGAGFYYIPGTDTCIKIGGWVRLYTLYGANGNSTNGALSQNAPAYKNDRTTNNFSWKERGYITADARTQTEYGTLRGYLDVGFSGDQPANSGPQFNSNRAFIQFAGFTFGLSQSFYDFYSQPAVSFFGGRITPNSDTGDAGQTVWAYTAQFGNGLSASLSAEAPNSNRRILVWNAGNPLAPGALNPGLTVPGNSYEGVQWPDFVANLRMDAAWGAAQIMGAIHDVSANYYSGTLGAANGHPNDETGWAIGAGVKINTPMIGAGDYFQTQVNYAEGATGYVAVPAAGGLGFGGWNGNEFGYAIQADGVYGGTLAAGNPTSISLTTAWGIAASYEHHWNKQWQTSLYGSYADFKYGGTGNALACAAMQASITAATFASCNNDFSYWDVGSRTQFNLDSNTYVGLDIVYQNLNTASSGVVLTPAAGGTTISDQHAWFGQFRVHRNFYP
jgi:Porin subfamily